ncbi:MAG: hypothetical protein CMH49_00845 [Myxococcales bacterium]|nr:hypothetical protein [Myxococcales bacterium]
MSSKPSKKYGQHELVAGRYLTSHVIGKGGMGKVVYGKHVDLQQEVAIKYLRINPRSGGENASKRFCQEALTYASVNHPNVVKLLDFERTQHGELRMVLEYVKGETLGTFLRRTGQCHPLFAIDITIQIAQGLSAAHAKSIIHRDLKPDNIMLSPLTKSRRHYHVKLLDFGIAKNLHHEGERYTAAGTVCGTPDYMSPEQARGLDIDTRSDIYSLGILLFEMLAGRLPYVATGKQKVMSAHCYTPIPMVSNHSTYPVPTVLEDLLQCCLAKNANDRFQSVEDLIRALEHVAEREYDQVSPTKFNALTPTGELIRFNQHPARDLDLLQQGSSIDLPINPSIAEFDRLKAQKLTGTEAEELDEVYSVGAQVKAQEPSNHASQQLPLSVIVNDAQSIKVTDESKPVMSSRKDKLLIDSPQASKKDFQIKGVSPKSMNVWLKSMWSDFNKYIELGNPQHMIVAMGTTLAIVFAISIGLQPKPIQSQNYDASTYTEQARVESLGADLQRSQEVANIEIDAVKESQKGMSARTSPFDSIAQTQVSPSKVEILAQKEQSKRKLNLLLENATDNYRRGRLKAVKEALAPYHRSQDHPVIKDLMSNVGLLQAFLAKSSKTSCTRFMKEQLANIHPGIIDHPLVKERVNHCKRVTPPDTL